MTGAFFDVLNIEHTRKKCGYPQRLFAKGGSQITQLRKEERAEGRAEGLEQGIRVFILDNLEEGISEERILKNLMKRFAMTENAAKEYLKKYQME